MSDPAQRPVAVVTGASGGIGRWIARGLAHAGYHVAMIGQDIARLTTAADWIEAEVKAASIDVYVADLSSMAQTCALSEQLLHTYPRLSLLVTNAGVFSHRRVVTLEGHEQVLAVNHLSPFLLTNMLLPALKAAGRARIVTIGSDTSDHADIDPSNLGLAHGWNYLRAYRRSKLAQMMTLLELAERLKGSGVTANVVHPGMVATRLVRAPGLIGLAWKCMAPFLLNEEQGAQTPLYVALDDSVNDITGSYFKKCKSVPPNPLALNPLLRRAVWESTECSIAGRLLNTLKTEGSISTHRETSYLVSNRAVSAIE